MKNKTVVPFVLIVGGLIGAAFYAIYSNFPMLPAAASAQAEHVDAAWNGLLIIEFGIYAVVVAFMIYCLIAFRAKDRKEQGDKFDRSPGYLVEVGWILVSTALCLGLAALGSHELQALIRDPSADIDVEVHAAQFSWEFYYPKYKTYGSALYMEKGKRHRLILTSKDVVHSFWVPEFRIKQDAVPGKVIPLILTPTLDGEYLILCNQLCGYGHTDMQSKVEVLDHDAFEKAVTSEF